MTQNWWKNPLDRNAPPVEGWVMTGSVQPTGYNANHVRVDDRRPLIVSPVVTQVRFADHAMSEAEIIAAIAEMDAEAA